MVQCARLGLSRVHQLGRTTISIILLHFIIEYYYYLFYLVNLSHLSDIVVQLFLFLFEFLDISRGADVGWVAMYGVRGLYVRQSGYV